MDNSLMGYVGAFIAVAIMLGIGTLILGGAATDCSTITGYDVDQGVGSVTVTLGGNYTTAPTVAFSGGGGAGATGSVWYANIAGGVEVVSVDVDTAGTDYSTAPTVSFVGGAPVNTTATATAALDGLQTGWALQCETNNTQSQAGYNLLIIVLIVLAAVVVLAVVRMLS
jgi:hypothetical protein